MKNATLKLIDFYADWCSPCIIMKPVIDDLDKELGGDLMIEKINIDLNPTLASQYQVFSIPTYVVVKDEKEVERVIGATSKDRLLDLIQKHLSQKD